MAETVLLRGIVGPFERECPTCGRTLTYAQRENWVRATKRNQSCRPCARRAQVDVSGAAKACTRCRQIKPLDRFVVDARAVSGYLSRCKDCELDRFATVRADLRRRVDDLKRETPCADCGGWFPPVCLDYDHLPGFEKRRGIAELVGRCSTWPVIELEIAKCELVCANCHRLRSAGRGWANDYRLPR